MQHNIFTGSRNWDADIFRGHVYLPITVIHCLTEPINWKTDADK